MCSRIKNSLLMLGASWNFDCSLTIQKMSLHCSEFSLDRVLITVHRAKHHKMLQARSPNHEYLLVEFETRAYAIMGKRMLRSQNWRFASLWSNIAESLMQLLVDASERFLVGQFFRLWLLSFKCRKWNPLVLLYPLMVPPLGIHNLILVDCNVACNGFFRLWS